MNYNSQRLVLAALCVWLCGCATTSIKQSWKSPTLQDRRCQKIGVLAVEERGSVRQALENRFADALREDGQNSMATFDLLRLPDIKADKEAAVARARNAGVDAVLIVRLVDQSTYNRQVRATPALYTPMVTGYETYGWHDYYSVAYMDMGVVWGSSRQDIYLDSTLFDLTTGQRLWSALTLTALKEDADRLAVADVLVAKVVSAMRKDGAIRPQ